MATRRKSINPNASRLNFRPPTIDVRSEPRGTKPTSKPTSVNEIFILMVLHICKKSLFFDTNLKIALYLGALFAISLLADVAQLPKTYFSRSDNVFNQYFVKIAWGWNLTLLVPYVILTSYTYCCGQKDKILKHLVRIGIATFFWWFWTSFFNFIETRYGMCNVKGDKYNTKQACLKAGFFWNGLDLSGHCFILIYGSLCFIEEARTMINWDNIKEFIRTEEHYRNSKDTSFSTNPLRTLTDNQLRILKTSYEKYTPYIRGFFIAITLFQILWDVMLVSTILYYHIMVEKFLGGVFAIITWFVTYRIWYKSTKFLPNLPGDGLFKYIKPKATINIIPPARKRAGSIVPDTHTQLPKFMGMPLYGLKTDSGNSPGPDENR